MGPNTTGNAAAALALCLAAACGKSATDGKKTDHHVRDGKGVTALFAGGRHSCVIRDGELRCWGEARNGSLGPGVTMTETSVPTPLPELDGVTAVALGTTHGCAIVGGGEVRCWGDNDDGSLGTGREPARSPTPVAVDLAGATDIAAGGDATCAIAKGKVHCWGGRFGSTPAVESGVEDATDVAVGEDHACAVAGGKVLCWGSDDKGQLGRPGAMAGTAMPVPDLDDVDEVAAAADHTCARRGGAVICWGDNDAGQLGHGNRGEKAGPGRVLDLDDAEAIAVGRRHSCALRKGGKVVCWGGSDRGSFGYPRGCKHPAHELIEGPSGVALEYCTSPTPVEGLRHTVALVHGREHACALDDAGTVRCWGAGGAGELGNRERGTRSSTTPVVVTFPEPTPASTATARRIGAGGSTSCAIVSDGNVRCWGAGSLGQLGPGAEQDNQAAPVTVPDVDGAAELSVGYYHSCVLYDDGGVRCWGHNTSGALGDGTTEKRDAPVSPKDLPPVVEISAARSSMGPHTCARTEAGAVWCWGDNRQGQANPGAENMSSPTPAAIPGVTGATQVVAGDQASCALAGGKVLCWGKLATEDDYVAWKQPTAVEGLPEVVEIGMGSTTYCAREANGTVWCWGARLGAPAKVELPAPAAHLAVAGSAAIVTTEDGRVFRRWVAQMGEPELQPITSPAQLSCATYHCCAIDADDHAVCWGSNSNGQLGDPDQGTGGESAAPVRARL